MAVLSDVSLSFAPGDAAAIMGPSGSGKSTLLYILGALEPPTTGTVTLDGTNPFSLPPKDLAAFRNKEIGFVFQDHCLLPQCSVLENVLVPTLVGPAEAGSDAHARALVDQVGLDARIDASAGPAVRRREAARGAGARARPPAAAAAVRRADGQSRSRIGRAVASLLLDLQQQQKAISIVVTHSAELASRFPIRFELVDRKLQRVA